MGVFSLIVASSSLFASEQKNVEIQCKLNPAHSGTNFETGTVLLTLTNNSGKMIPADTIQLKFGSHIQLETAVLPFDSVPAGASFNMVLPYRRVIGAVKSDKDILAASVQRQDVDLLKPN